MLAADSRAQQRALELLAHDSVLGVARRGKTFRPVEANTGDRAADTFVLREGSAFYVAIFNYRLTSETKTVDLARVGASPGKSVTSQSCGVVRR